MNYLKMTGYIVRTASDNWTLGYEGENNARTLRVKTTDSLTNFATVNLLIDTLDCGAMTIQTVSNYRILEMVITEEMLGLPGLKTCQLVMKNTAGSVVLKTNQFYMYVKSSNVTDRIYISTEDTIKAALTALINDGVLEDLSIEDGSITTSKIANGAITQAKLDPNISFEADGELDATSTNAIQNKVVAQAIGEVNESLSEVRSGDRVAISWTLDGYLNTSGSTVNISAVTSSQNFRYSITPAQEGDIFFLNVTGGISPRAWCFVDASYNVLSVSDASVVCSDTKVVAPQGTAYAIIQDNTRIKDSYKSCKLIERIQNAEISNDIKTALLACFAHVAWIDEDGRDYYNALSSALYEGSAWHVTYNLFGCTSSNEADYSVTGSSYTSTITVIESGDSIMHASVFMGGVDITESAYSNGVISIASVTGDLVITATTASYPMENGEHLFTSNERKLKVTNGNHFVYEAPNASSSSGPTGGYLLITPVSKNDNSGTSNPGGRVTDPWFTIPAGAHLEFSVKNISVNRYATAKFAVSLRDMSNGLIIGTGDTTALNDITVTYDAESAVTAKYIFMYLTNQYSRFEADIEIIVDGVRYV